MRTYGMRNYGYRQPSYKSVISLINNINKYSSKAKPIKDTADLSSLNLLFLALSLLLFPFIFLLASLFNINLITIFTIVICIAIAIACYNFEKKIKRQEKLEIEQKERIEEEQNKLKIEIIKQEQNKLEREEQRRIESVNACFKADYNGKYWYNQPLENTYQFLYLLRNEIGLYKIGISKNVRNRVNQLRNTSGLDVSIISVYKTSRDAKYIEKYLHKKYSSYRKNGEWFDFGDNFNIDDFHSNFDGKLIACCNKYYLDLKSEL